MAFSGATKKLQQVVDMADKLYTRLDELRQQLQAVREQVEETSDRVERMERELEGQQALLVAIAERQGVDVDEVLTASAIDEAEVSGDDSQLATDAGKDATGGSSPAEMDTPTEESGGSDAEADETFE